jgi:hypothetical protein
MRAKLVTILVTLSITLAGTMLMSGSATGKTTLHFKLPFSLKVRALNFGRASMDLGDRLAARGPLMNADQSERVGTSHLECVVDRRITEPDGGVYNCTYVLELDDGLIMLHGLDPHGPGSSQFAVTGGTGSYSDASGEATFTDVDEITDMVIELP